MLKNIIFLGVNQKRKNCRYLLRYAKDRGFNNSLVYTDTSYYETARSDKVTE